MDSWLELVRTGFAELFAGTLQSIAPFTVRALQALVVLVIVRYVTRRLKRLVRLSASRIDLHSLVLAERTIDLLGWAVVVLIALAIAGIDLTALAAVIGVFTLAVSVALQDLLKNFVAGVYLLIERPYQIGQVIKVKDHEGVVDEVRLRVTVLVREDGSRVIVPNSVLFAEAVVSRSAAPGDA